MQRIAPGSRAVHEARRASNHGYHPWIRTSRGYTARAACRPNWLLCRYKSTSTVKISSIPQGLIRSEPLEPFQEVTEKDNLQYPTVMQGVKNNMAKFENCVILTRVGNFYELYFEQAEEYAHLLNLKLAWRKTSVGPVAMAGFPHFQLDRFLKILVEDYNKHVAISEEFRNHVVAKSKSGGLLFDRRVARIVTPGTLIDEKFMEQNKNNYLLAIHIDHDQNLEEALNNNISSLATQEVGLAWLDLSTGDFYTEQTIAGMLPSALARVNAREIIMDKLLQASLGQQVQSFIGRDHNLVTFHSVPSDTQGMSKWDDMLASPVSQTTDFTKEEVAAGNTLLDYVQDQLQGSSMTLQPPVRKTSADSMVIDRNSLRGLEILETSKSDLTKGSLLQTIRRTSTKSGERLLRERLTSPSATLPVITERLDLVQSLVDHSDLREGVVGLLKQSYDAQRLVQKFSLARGDADDLICLSRAISASNGIAHILKQQSNIDSELGSRLEPLLSRFDLEKPVALAQRISEAIDEEGLMKQQSNEEDLELEAAAETQDIILSEGATELLEDVIPKMIQKKVSKRVAKEDPIESEDTWIMRRNASETLDKLHDELQRLYGERVQLTEDLRLQMGGASSLTLKWSPGLGHHCHVKGSDTKRALDLLAEPTRVVSSTKSTKAFYLPSWTRLGNQIDRAKTHIRTEEERIFQKLRHEVLHNLIRLRRNAAILDELDVACSFATLALEQNLTRPILNTSTTHHIISGRHPTVSIGLEENGRTFIGNDLLLNSDERIWLITGPNMAGKSTFLRQNALITILAQVGSFVPCAHATLGIVDQIFSRIGSADDLYRDQSTFMVEMLETAAILNQATHRSFAIMDEVGRGTTPEDGTAVAYACLHHLHHKNKCRTLFATHFHALASMATDFDRLGRYCTDIVEFEDGTFTFAHKLRKGVNFQSHALKVAKLAGLPIEALEVAEKALETIKAERERSN